MQNDVEKLRRDNKDLEAKVRSQQEESTNVGAQVNVTNMDK